MRRVPSLTRSPCTSPRWIPSSSTPSRCPPRLTAGFSIQSARWHRASLADWFILDPEDDRNQHMLISQEGTDWRPLLGTERLPMILVSWFGANAYSLWANGRDWSAYQGEPATEPESFLPSEAQWEYAARGAFYRTFPWGDEPPSQERMRYGQHRKGMTYRADTLPMADVNDELGMSPFGLHHMAGNVWQWCRDWYDDAFYSRHDATQANPVNRQPTKVRSERGGSWIGPADLCRSSFRRGRPPMARGRCLGFRCVSSRGGCRQPTEAVSSPWSVNWSGIADQSADLGVRPSDCLGSKLSPNEIMTYGLDRRLRFTRHDASVHQPAPSMTRERESWKPTEADGPETKPEKPGTPTTDRFGSPDGLGSSRRMPTSIESSSIYRHLHAPSSTDPCPFSEPQLNASC